MIILEFSFLFQISGNLTVYVQVVQCIDCPYEIIAQDLSSAQLINLTLNTKFTYRIRIELNNVSFCSEILIVDEHGQYIFNVQPPVNASSDNNLQCTLKSQRFTNNVYTPLIVGAVILIGLFISSILGQRMQLREQLIKLKNRCFNHVPPQESTHSYDLQTCPQATTICQSAMDPMNNGDCNQNNTKLPPIHKVSRVIVPRSKRLLSLDTFRGFGWLISLMKIVLYCSIF